MHIVYFNYLYDLFGVSIGSTIKAIELMRALTSQGYQVDTFWWKENESTGVPGIQDNMNRQWIKQRFSKYLHEPNQLLKNFRYYRDENRILSVKRPSLFISRLETYIFSAFSLARRYRLPFIVEVDSPVSYELRHFGQSYYHFDHLVEKLELAYIKRAYRAFCVSHQLKAYFVKRGIPDHKIQVITNGADISRFHPNMSSEKVFTRYPLAGKRVVGFVGSFHHWHGVYHLIELIDKILHMYPDVVFLLVGHGGPLKDTINRYVSENGLSERIILTGLVKHGSVPAYINAMDVVLAPYPPLEFFYYSPVKIFEYMACGRAVVSSRIGQIEELIQHGETGMLCTPGRTDDMIDAVKSLLNHAGLRKRIGENAARFIASKHTWQHKAAALSELCQNVVDSHHSM